MTYTEPRRVLIIDDNPVDAELNARALRRCPVPSVVCVAGDPLTGLGWLTGTLPPPASLDRLPALVLLDIKMPRLDGFELLRRLRQHPRTHAVPVVLLTSSNEERDVVDGYDAGANAFVTKPITSEQFLEAVQALGRFWLGHNRVPRDGDGGLR